MILRNQLKTALYRWILRGVCHVVMKAELFYKLVDLVLIIAFHLILAVLRAIGIPTRSVTNFSSAHDSDASMTIDFHFDEDGKPIKELDDSIWWVILFHLLYVIHYSYSHCANSFILLASLFMLKIVFIGPHEPNNLLFLPNPPPQRPRGGNFRPQNLRPYSFPTICPWPSEDDPIYRV